MIGNILRNIIIPEQIGSHYIIPTRIVGFDIGNTHVCATKIVLKGTAITIEQTIIEPLENNAEKPYEQLIAEAIKSILKRIGAYNRIRSSLSSSVALFKELTLPFVEHDKIKKILAYEIEQFLPFALTDLVIDFIITATNPQQQSATIFAVAIKKEYIAAHLALFAAAGVAPDTITLDLFDLYGLYGLIPTYAQQFESCALLDIGLNSTRIMYITHNTLRALRIIPQGISHCTQNLAQTLSISNEQAFEKIKRMSMQPNESRNAEIAQLFAQFFQDIQFTILAFEQKFNENHKTDRVLTLGFAQFPTIVQYSTQQLAIPTASFDSNELTKNKHIAIKHQQALPQESTYSIACALVSPRMQYFNLRQEEFALRTERVFVKQFMVALSLLMMIVGSLVMHTLLQRWHLKNALQGTQQQIVSALYSHNLTEKQEAMQAEEALSDAQQKVADEKEIWFAFSSQARFSFLAYLQALSTAIDKKSTGIKLTKLQITYDKIIFDGEVPDFAKLAILDKELAESPVLNFKTSIPTLKFSNIEITIKHPNENT